MVLNETLRKLVVSLKLCTPKTHEVNKWNVSPVKRKNFFLLRKRCLPLSGSLENTSISVHPETSNVERRKVTQLDTRTSFRKFLCTCLKLKFLSQVRTSSPTSTYSPQSFRAALTIGRTFRICISCT